MTLATIRRLVQVVVVAGALCAPATAASGQVSPPPPPPGLGVRLLQGPAGSVDDPRAHEYIVDQLAPGATISRQIGFTNGDAEPADLSFYAAAAEIHDGGFVPGAGRAANELTSWTTFSPASATRGAGRDPARDGDHRSAQRRHGRRALRRRSGRARPSPRRGWRSELGEPGRHPHLPLRRPRRRRGHLLLHRLDDRPARRRRRSLRDGPGPQHRRAGHRPVRRAGTHQRSGVALRRTVPRPQRRHPRQSAAAGPSPSPSTPACQTGRGTVGSRSSRERRRRRSPAG